MTNSETLTGNKLYEYKKCLNTQNIGRMKYRRVMTKS